MRTDNSKEVAQYVFDYSIAVANEHSSDWITVLTHLQKLIKVQLNIAEASDSQRNK